MGKKRCGVCKVEYAQVLDLLGQNNLCCACRKLLGELLVEKHNVTLKNLVFQVFLNFLSQKCREKFPLPNLKIKIN